MPPAADEIRALAITLNGMLDRLAAARERQRSFVADAAHELRSPLASMRAQLEVAQRLGEGGTLPADLLADLRPAVRAGRGPAAAGPGRRRHPAAGRGRAWSTAGHLLAEVAAAYAGQRVPVTVRTGAGGDDARPTRRSCAGRWTTWSPTPSGTPTPAVELAAGRRSATRCVLTVRDDGPGIAERGSGAGLRAVHPAGRRPGPRLRRVRAGAGRSCGSWSAAPAATVALSTPSRPGRWRPMIRLPRARSTPDLLRLRIDHEPIVTGWHSYPLVC